MTEEERRHSPVSDEPVAEERDFEAHQLTEEEKKKLEAERRAEEDEPEVEGHMPIQERPVQERPVQD